MTVGCELYPEPEFVITTCDTLPLASKTAVPAALVPPPPLNETEGAETYLPLVVGLLIVTEETLCPRRVTAFLS